MLNLFFCLKEKVCINCYIRLEVEISFKVIMVIDIICVGVIMIVLKKKCVFKNMYLN